MKKINGYIAAPFTPMKENGDLNLDLIPEYADYLVRNGIDGAFVCGSTGEGALLNLEERMAVAEKWLEVSSGRLKVIVHTAGTNISEQQILAKHAEKIEAFAISAMAPTFLAPTRNEELVAYCKAIASAAPSLPFYYYHIPSLNNFKLPVTEFLSVAEKEIPNLAGVKYSDFNIFEFELCKKIADGKFEMLYGIDEMFLDNLCYDSNGGVGGTYNHCFKLYANMKTAFEKGDLQSARELQYKSHKFCKILGKYRGNIVGGKRIMKFIGLDCGPNRLPLQSISAEEEISIKTELDDIGFFEFCNK